MKDILITGGAGYVGSALTKAILVKRKDFNKIIVYDNLSKGRLQAIGHLMDLLKKKLIMIKADIRDPKDMEKVFQNFQIHTVIHLAAIVDAFSTNREGKDTECYFVNDKATKDLATLAKKYKVKDFIYQSSVSVYSKGENLKENDKKSPITAYGITKLKGEEILKLDDENFNLTILRPATVFGYSPGFRYETVINYFIVRAFYKMRLPVFKEALESEKSFIDIEDNVNAILFTLKNMNKMKGQIFNISSFNCNLKAILNVMKRHFPQLEIDLIGTPNITQQPYTISSEKFRSLGFKPKGNLENGVKYFKKYLKRDYHYLFRNYIIKKELLLKTLLE